MPGRPRRNTSVSVLSGSISAVTGTTEGAIIVTTAAITGGIILIGMAIATTAAVIGIMAADMDIMAAEGAAARPCQSFEMD
jgi:hypothetical protein